MRRPVLLLTRPDDEAGRSAQAARQAGFDMLAAPLLAVEPVAFAIPEGNVDALLFTSPRAPAIVARQAPGLLAFPVLCVGPRTAGAAENAGFEVVSAGETDGVAIVRDAALRGYRRLLQPCGENRIDIPLPEGVSLQPVAVYRAVAAESLPAVAQTALAEGRLFAAMLFSPRTARIFAALVDRAAIGRSQIRLIALSPNVREAAGNGWRAVATAELPGLDEAMAAAARLWQDLPDD